MKALLVIDVQNDFCPGGSLAVAGGGDVVPVINNLMAQHDIVILTQDWHPLDHFSFAVNHNKNPYDVVQAEYGDQVLWPAHCVQGSSGADFHPDLLVDGAHSILRKGFRKSVDSYSAFLENDKKTPTGLEGIAKNLGITEFVVAGLATDFCVKWSVLDGLDLGFKMSVVASAVRGIDIDNSVELAFEQMILAGASIV